MIRYLAHFFQYACLTIVILSCTPLDQRGSEESSAKQLMSVASVERSIRLSVDGLPRRDNFL